MIVFCLCVCILAWTWMVLKVDAPVVVYCFATMTSGIPATPLASYRCEPLDWRVPWFLGWSKHCCSNHPERNFGGPHTSVCVCFCWPPFHAIPKKIYIDDRYSHQIAIFQGKKRPIARSPCKKNPPKKHMWHGIVFFSSVWIKVVLCCWARWSVFLLNSFWGVQKWWATCKGGAKRE